MVGVNHNVDEKGVAYQLLGMLQHYAPSGEAQQACTAGFNAARADGLSDREIATIMAGALYTGLKFGNWPWTDTRSN